MKPINILQAVPDHKTTRRRLEEKYPVKFRIIPHMEEARQVDRVKLEDVDILFTSDLPTNFDDMKSLRWIQIDSAGYDQLLGCKLIEKNILASNSLGVFDIPIAEWCISMMIQLKRDMPAMYRNQCSGIWDRCETFQQEIRGCVLGIWGYGGIGRETARLASTLGLKIHVMTRSAIKKREQTYHIPGTGDPNGILPDKIFTPEHKKEFLQGLDFLLLSMPQTQTTQGIVGQEELLELKDHAFILNPARGPLIDEASLVDALKQKTIAGAALDTHYHYPLPADHPLWPLQNVILTPHISGSSGSPRFIERIWDIFALNLARYLEQQPLLNQLSPSQLQAE